MSTKELIRLAAETVNYVAIDNADMGGVACALVTDKGTVFKGVCIDAISGMGFCAEHTAISQMITQGEYRVRKIVAVKKDEAGNIHVLAPCGRCREFMYQTNKENLATEVILGARTVVPLRELLPYPDHAELVG